jgi:hypothetical protein
MKLTRFIILSALLLALTPAAALAQSHGRLPNDVSLSIGYFEPRGSGDLWSINQRHLGVDEQDFGDVLFAFRIAAPINRFVAFESGAGYYQADVETEDQDFTYTSGRPIEQDLHLDLLPLTVTMKIMPFGMYSEEHPEGPLRKVIPYLGIGGGALLWEYREHGDFVFGRDQAVPTLVHDEFTSQGVAFEYHGVLGVDINLAREMALFVEARWSRARDDLSSDYSGFDEFDLSGDSLSVGLRFRF